MKTVSIFYLAKDLADKHLGEGQYTVLQEMKGAELEYQEYEQLMPFLSRRIRKPSS